MLHNILHWHYLNAFHRNQERQLISGSVKLKFRPWWRPRELLIKDRQAVPSKARVVASVDRITRFLLPFRTCYLHAALVSPSKERVSSRIGNCVASGYEEEEKHLISEASLWEHECEFHFQSNKNSFVAYPSFPTRASQTGQCPHCGYLVYHIHAPHSHSLLPGCPMLKSAITTCHKVLWCRCLQAHTRSYCSISTVILLIYVQNNKEN